MIESLMPQPSESYNNLASLIKTRKLEEKWHAYSPYTDYKTDVNFKDMHGYALLHYAAEMGDLEKIKECLNQGANIDLNTQHEALPALSLALKKGHVAVAEYLHQCGAKLPDLPLSECATDESKKWLQERIKDNLNNASSDIDKLEMAAKIGDINVIISEIKNNPDVIKWDILLNKALINGQLPVVMLAMDYGAIFDPIETYAENALHIAISHNHLEIVIFLLQKNINVNKQDEMKISPLMAAIRINNPEIINAILSKNPDLTLTNLNNETILHYVAQCEDVEIAKKILELCGDKIQTMLNKTNIFGFTPLDIAIQNKNDTLIILMLSYQQSENKKSINDIRQLPAYGNPPPNIDQYNIIERKLRYYLIMQRRDTQFLNEGGSCNGLVFLLHRYAAENREDYFFDTLALMSNWDGSEESLRKNFDDIPQKKYYKNLAELFEQWINDIIWFQNVTIPGIYPYDQTNRSCQYSVIGDSEDFKPITFSCLYYCKLGISISLIQLREIFLYLQRLPAHARIELAGNSHAIALYHTREQQILTLYDPSMSYKRQPSQDMEELFDTLINYKYITLNEVQSESASKIKELFHVFYFNRDKNAFLKEIDAFEVLSKEELPKSKEQALEFQRNSSNKFTPLHIAVITKSRLTLSKLLEDNYCNINAEDCNGKSPLDFTIAMGDCSLVNLLLSNEAIQCTDAHVHKANEFANQQVMNFESTEIMILLLKKINQHSLIMSIFNMALLEKKYALLELLLANFTMLINQADQDLLPIVKAIRSNDEKLIDILLKNKADIKKKYKKYGVTDDTPLSFAIQFSNKKNAICIINQLDDINSLDELGNTALFYAVIAKKIDIIKYLLDKKADPRVENNKHESVLSILKESGDRELNGLFHNYGYCINLRGYGS